MLHIFGARKTKISLEEGSYIFSPLKLEKNNSVLFYAEFIPSDVIERINKLVYKIIANESFNIFCKQHEMLLVKIVVYYVKLDTNIHFTHHASIVIIVYFTNMRIY